MRYLHVKDIKEQGYYWWLPEYLSDEPANQYNWQIIFIEVEGPQRCTVKVGVFVGPLFPPLSEGVR